MQQARRRLGLTSEDLALACQLEPRVLLAFEEGQAPLDPPGLLRACLALEISPMALFGDCVTRDGDIRRAIKHIDFVFTIHAAVVSSNTSGIMPSDSGAQASNADTWWIRQGHWIPRSTAVLEGEIAQLLTRGAIALKICPEFVWLCWDVETVDAAALAEALDYLDCLQSGHRVIFKFRKSAWAREQFANPEAAIKRMQDLISYKSIDVALQTSIRRLELSEIQQAHPLLQHAMSNWLDAQVDTYWPATSSADWALVFDRERDDLLFSHIGRASEARRRLGANWRQAAIGATCHNGFIDSEFNKRADEAYWTAIEEKVPVLNHVLAYIKTHEGADWLPYQRLTLPTRNGVAVFTKVTPDISVPFLGRAA